MQPRIQSSCGQLFWPTDTRGCVGRKQKFKLLQPGVSLLSAQWKGMCVPTHATIEGDRIGLGDGSAPERSVGGRPGRSPLQVQHAIKLVHRFRGSMETVLQYMAGASWGLAEAVLRESMLKTVSQ